MPDEVMAAEAANDRYYETDVPWFSPGVPLARDRKDWRLQVISMPADGRR